MTMLRLDEVLDWLDGRGYSNLGFILFGLIYKYYCVDSGTDVVDKLKGLCPERILINDGWWITGINCIDIVEAEPSDFSIAYFPPEYLERGEWNESSTVFALCVLIYRIWTLTLPYLDDPNDEEVDGDNLDKIRAKNVAMGRRYPLFLDDIPEMFRDFIRKGLSLQPEHRYQSVKEAFEDFTKIPYDWKLETKDGYQHFNWDQIIL